MSSKTIVVGMDASPESLRAAALAWKIGRATRATCRLVHAVREPLAARAARAALVARLRRVVPPTLVRMLDVRPGRAGRVLAERAARYKAVLVVLGRKHHGALARAVGGSTAHYLVRTLDVPILIGSSAAVRRVLVAVDRSTAAQRTLREARALTRRLGAVLRVLHVVEPVRYPYPVPRALDRKTLRRRSVESFKRFARALGVPEGEQAVRSGVAAAAIAAEAARWRADVVVVGSHGKGFVDRVLIGSTTEWLLQRLTGASLLVVPVGRAA